MTKERKCTRLAKYLFLFDLLCTQKEHVQKWNKIWARSPLKSSNSKIYFKINFIFEWKIFLRNKLRNVFNIEYYSPSVKCCGTPCTITIHKLSSCVGPLVLKLFTNCQVCVTPCTNYSPTVKYCGTPCTKTIHQLSSIVGLLVLIIHQLSSLCDPLY